MADAIAIGLIGILLFLAIRYIVKQKKAGAHCIGCPAQKGCCHCSKKKL